MEFIKRKLLMFFSTTMFVTANSACTDITTFLSVSIILQVSPKSLWVFMGFFQLTQPVCTLSSIFTHIFKWGIHLQIFSGTNIIFYRSLLWIILFPLECMLFAIALAITLPMVVFIRQCKVFDIPVVCLLFSYNTTVWIRLSHCQDWPHMHGIPEQAKTIGIPLSFSIDRQCLLNCWVY